MSGLYQFTAFHRNLVDFILRSFLLILHRPAATKARKDPKYYFSRKACLDAALTLIFPEPNDEYLHLRSVGAGFMRSIYIHCGKLDDTSGKNVASAEHLVAGSVISLELIAQVEEDDANMALQRNGAIRESLRQALQSVIDMAQLRIQMGETNIRGHIFYSMVSIDGQRVPEDPRFDMKSISIKDTDTFQR